MVQGVLDQTVFTPKEQGISQVYGFVDQQANSVGTTCIDQDVANVEQTRQLVEFRNTEKALQHLLLHSTIHQGVTLLKMTTGEPATRKYPRATKYSAKFRRFHT